MNTASNTPRVAPWTAWFAHAVIGFMVVPTLLVVPISFNGDQYLRFPPRDFSLRWYEDFWSNEQWLHSAWISLVTALAVMAIATTLGTLAALALHRMTGASKKILLGLMMSPLMVPTVVLALALYFFFARLQMVGTWTAVVLGQVILAIPFTVLNVHASLQGYPATLERAASSLGAGPATTFFRITVPIIRPGILSGALFAFMVSFDEFIIALFLAGPGETTLPVRMWQTMQLYISPTIAAVSSMITGITIAIFVASHALRRRANRRRFAERQPGTSRLASTRGHTLAPASGRWTENRKLMSTEV
ncbi:ABC transporter permease [Microvirga vignae]|uniref:ABC transporter permease n=1 Tax=Microvirga vignae TaxID=1225564 RepID=UPI00069B0176|nr:ABC transporter permease [Microvirga vignae]